MNKENNNNTIYKDTPLGKIPSDWVVEELGKVILDSYSGGTPSRNVQEYYNNGTIPWIKSGEINQIYINETEECITEKALKNSSAKITPKGTLLYALYGATAGVVGFTNINAALNQAILAIFPDEKRLLKNYLFFYLGFNKDNILNEFTQGGQPNLSAGLVKGLKLSIPSLPEQKAIAQLLSTWDKAISKTQALLLQKELSKKWLMQNLLTGKKRVKGYKEAWKEVRLNEVFDRVTRKNIENNTNVVTISAQRGFVRQTDFFNKNIASEITDNYFLVKKGEFCYNKSYSNGYPWGATKRLNDFEKAVVTTLYICFSIKDETKTSGDFFEQYFEANLLDIGLTKIAHEGGRAHGLLNVTPSDFFALKITIPSFDEQTAIARLLQAADKEIQLLKSKAEKLKEEKKGMMQILFTGKKRLEIN